MLHGACRSYRGLYILNWIYRFFTEKHYRQWLGECSVAAAAGAGWQLGRRACAAGVTVAALCRAVHYTDRCNKPYLSAPHHSLCTVDDARHMIGEAKSLLPCCGTTVSWFFLTQISRTGCEQGLNPVCTNCTHVVAPVHCSVDMRCGADHHLLRLLLLLLPGACVAMASLLCFKMKPAQCHHFVACTMW
jgi:hypothetical protein